MLTRLHIGLFFFLFGSGITQQFSPSPQWRRPGMTISSQERMRRASDALKTTMLIFDETSGYFAKSIWGSGAGLYLCMVEFDLATNGTQYKDKLLSYFPKVEVARPGFLDTLIYGIAAVKAHAAYNDGNFLVWAETAWKSARPFVISDSDVQYGRALKKPAIVHNCSGASLAGGAFYTSRFIGVSSNSDLSMQPTG
ncbi:hypothetical protein PQX77_011281 [Marasmius sp. AFHP31]|nr:hypothetical protein PQX77_011281 [Marasmius sp. AFHP31]